jgi:S-adenosylhomocysteine hydrolase
MDMHLDLPLDLPVQGPSDPPSGSAPALSDQSPATAVTELQGTAEQGRLVLAEVLDRVEAAFPAAARRHRLGPGAWLVPLDAAGHGSMLIAIAPASRPRDRGNAQLVLSATLLDRGGITEADAARALGCLEGVPFTGHETEAFTEQLPLLAGLPDRVRDKPLGGCGVVLVGHLLSDLVVQTHTLLALGARPDALTVLKKEYPHKLRQRVEAHLTGLGVAVLPVSDAEIALRLHAARICEPSVLIDDGGHVLPALMRQAPDLLPRLLGVVEQSLSGIEELEDAAAATARPVPVPVFSVAQSSAKRGVEAHWVAESVVRSIRDLVPGEDFDEAPALVIGFGMVGEQVARVLSGQRMRVAVYDTEWRRLVAAHEAGFLTAPDLAALLDGHRPALIVSATGGTGLGGEDLDYLPGDCFIASVSGRAAEIDLPGLAERAEQIERVGELARVGMRYTLPNGPVTVLADGLPVNLVRGERVPARQSDLAMAAVAWGACVLARGGSGFGAGVDVGRTDAAIEESGLVERYYQLYGADS